MSKSITIFTESFPLGKGEIFLKGELESLTKAYDEIILMPMGISNAKPHWYKGIEPEISGKLPRLKTLVKSHWRQLFSILKMERKASKNGMYLKKPLYFLKMLLYALNKAYELNRVLPKETELYSYWYSNWTLNISLLKAILRPNASWVSRTHGFDVDVQQVVSGYYPFRKWNNTQLNKVICISSYGKQLFTRDNPEYKGEVEVSYLGIGEQGFAPIPKGKTYIIVSCSSVIPLKRLDKMASILSYLNRRVLWVHFGDGPDMGRVNKYLDRLPDNIGYEFKGNTPNKEILQYYQENEVDLFMNTSKLEGIPFSMIEAAASGIPIAGFNICGIPEIITKYMGVLLDESISNEENADKIKSFLLSALGRNEKYRKNIQLEINRTFSSDINYQKFTKIIAS